jgi:cysteine desulfurase family protein (TIGR01976 family)
MIGEKFPIDHIRPQFPALKRIYKGRPVVYLDGVEGIQLVDTAIKAITNYMVKGTGNPHGQSLSSRETENIIRRAKEAIGDMFNVNVNEIAFGFSATTLEFVISRAIAKELKSVDEIVVSELDSSSNIEPWLEIARDKGINVRWLKVKKDSLIFDLSELYSVINENTRVVVIEAASNITGTINEVEIISERARSVGAIVVVNAVHAAPHFSINKNKLGADILLCSAHKFFGPQVGIAIIGRDIFKKLDNHKLKLALNCIPDKLETEEQNYDAIAGIEAAVDFIASLGIGNTRREKIISGFEQIEAYECRLASKLRKKLVKVPKIKLYQSPEWVKKTPIISFKIDGMLPQEVCKFMSEEYSIFITEGNFCVDTLSDNLDSSKRGGLVTIGIAPYNTEEEIEYFIDSTKNLIGK